MGSVMEILQVEAFVQAAREGNFTRAAEALNVTQPAISARIQSLEAELGGKLFRRQGRTLALTELGLRFLPYAQRLLAVQDDALQAAHDFRTGKVGAVRVAAPTPFVLSFLVDTLEDFRRQHPTIDVWIRERPKTSIVNMIHDGVITLGLVSAPVLDRQMKQLLRLEDPILCVVGATHPLAQASQPVHVDALYAHTIFRVSMFPQMSKYMDEIVEQGRQGTGGAVIAIPMVMALRLVLQGQGVTFLPASYVQPAMDSGALLALELTETPQLMNEPVLVTHRDRALDDLHHAFVTLFEARWGYLKR